MTPHCAAIPTVSQREDGAPRGRPETPLVRVSAVARALAVWVPSSFKAFEATAAWESGRRLLRVRDFSGAREQFRLACKLDPRQGAYRMYFLWSARQAADGRDTEQRYPQELKRLAEAHTCIEGHIGIASYILGHLALSEGNERTAERCFKEAFNSDPEMREAEDHYRRLVRRRRYR